MRKRSSAVLIYGGIGLTGFGVAYDSGFFGPADGHDHSAVFAVAPGATVTSTSISDGATYVVVNSITGAAVVAPLPTRKTGTTESK
jgi:hypothetical protein